MISNRCTTFVSFPARSLFACTSSPSTPSTSSTGSVTPSTPPSKPTVFVAGATGNVGVRLIRLLSESGCNVRTISRDRRRYERPVLSDDVDVDSAGEIKHFELDITRADSVELKRAISEDSDIVVSALGAPFSFGKVDGFGIARLMTAASELQNVKSMIVVSSIGVGRPWAFPAAVLNLFGGVLLFKDYSEQVTRKVANQSHKKYLIVRPGGMESPTDDFGKTHNVRIMKRNSLAGGLVSNLQIAQLITAVCLNPEKVFAEDAKAGKTIEVVAEIDAPNTPLLELLQNAQCD